MTDKIVVMSTCATGEEAEKIARHLIGEKLAACVNVLPGARSFYRWQGAIEDTAEFLLIIKTSRALFKPLQIEIEKLHSYEVPELVALPILDGSLNYMNWLQGELSAAVNL